MSCSTDLTAFTESDLNATYGNGKPGILPRTPSNDSERENGMLNANTVKEIVDNLKKSGVIPTLTVTNTDTFFENQRKLLADIQSEYCFYYSRYSYSLRKLLKVIGDGYSNRADTYTVNAYLNYTRILNRKMNDLIQITNGITEELIITSGIMQKEVMEYDKEMKDMQTKLAEQNKIISSTEAVARLNKEMVKYTEQKSVYTDNLLKMYSVFNIVAFGLLVYVYTSVNE